MFHVILYQPEIPPNTGNLIRLCANTGCCLHLIKPMGFDLDDAKLRRAGLDYHDLATVRSYEDWKSYLEHNPTGRIWAFSTRGTRRYCDARFQDGDGLLFGPETRGLPAHLLEDLGEKRTLRLPMLGHSRSINLSNAAAVAVYEALRQRGFAGLG